MNSSNQSVVCATEVCGQALGISWNSLTGYATSLCVCVHVRVFSGFYSLLILKKVSISQKKNKEHLFNYLPFHKNSHILMDALQSDLSLHKNSVLKRGQTEREKSSVSQEQTAALLVFHALTLLQKVTRSFLLHFALV